MKILVLNSGSSSQKSCLYEIGDSVPDDPPPPQWEGKIEWDGEVAEVSLKNAKEAARKERTKAGSRAEAVEQLLSTLWNGDTRAVSARSGIDVVGHRVEPGLVDVEGRSGHGEDAEEVAHTQPSIAVLRTWNLPLTALTIAW